MDNIIIVMFAAIIIIGGLLLLVIIMTRKGPRVLDQSTYRSKWLAIESILGSDEATRHIAIIKADTLLDRALRERGVKGATMGDRMKQAKSLFSNNNAIWAAHKLRNKIAHEDDITIQDKTARQALKAFKIALKDVGAL
jgi:hypothetical protein